MENMPRKLVSIALMSIMVAGGLTFAVPGMAPDAHAAPKSLANLGVSSTIFGGPMVLEIIIKDPNIDDTNTVQGEPDVSFDGNDLRMIQGSDGYWYAYVANKDHVETIEASDTDVSEGMGMDFGTVCPSPNNSANIILEGKTFAEGVALYTASNVTCSSEATSDTPQEQLINVLRSAKSPSAVEASPGNNKLTNIGFWPFIQAFEVTPDSTIDVVYNKGGSPQEITVTYDNALSDDATFALDRPRYPHATDVHLTISDNLLNIDPTDEDIWTFDTDVDSDDAYYHLFNSAGDIQIEGATDMALGDAAGMIEYSDQLPNVDFGTTGGTLNIIPGEALTYRGEGADDNNDSGNGNGDETVGTLDHLVTLQEDGPNSGVFENTDGSNDSNLVTTSDDIREKDFIIDYDDTPLNWLVGYTSAVLEFDEAGVGSDWNSGEPITITLADEDYNKNSLVQEVIPADTPIAIHVGADDMDEIEIEPAGFLRAAEPYNSVPLGIPAFLTTTVTPVTAEGVTMLHDTPTLNQGVRRDLPLIDAAGNSISATILNDVPGRQLWLHTSWPNYGGTQIKLWSAAPGNDYFNDGAGNFLFISANSGLVRIDDHPNRGTIATHVHRLQATVTTLPGVSATFPVTFILHEYRQTAIAESALEETGLNTGIFQGTIEYIMLNQLNSMKNDAGEDVAVTATAEKETTFVEDSVIILDGDYTDEDGIRVDYTDMDKQGKETIISAKVDAPTHSGSITLDADNYKRDDTVIVTLEDADLNIDSELREIYTPIDVDDSATRDTIARDPGNNNYANKDDGIMLEATFNDVRWVRCTGSEDTTGFGNEISTLRETGTDTGVFTTDFQVPAEYCTITEATGGTVGTDTADTTLGRDLEVTYYDFRDAAGEPNEVGDVAGITAYTGSVSFDKSVYPVPFGDGEGTNPGFSMHSSAENDAGDTPYLDQGDTTVHIQVKDFDLDTSAAGVDNPELGAGANQVQLDVEITRGSAEMTVPLTGFTNIRETAAGSGTFELDLPITYNAGPTATCPTPEFAAGTGCVLQGDIITVTYTDRADASGKERTVTDSATFDLRNGVLQSDKSVYIIGTDMILTLIDPDLDLDNDGRERYTLDLIEWDSDAARGVSMGEFGGPDTNAGAIFDPEPSDLLETGDSTGIFQSVIEIPEEIGGEPLERGEEITLEYTDWGPSGANYVGHESEDVTLEIFTSNFGATIELDQKVYTWTDKIFINIVAPDHNFDSNLIDEIGEDNNPIKVATRIDSVEYRLTETGPDTGIFSGEVILVGFPYDADGDSTTGSNADGTGAGGFDVGTIYQRTATGNGPTDGFIPADDDDGFSVSFEFSEDETVVTSALIRWNIGEVEWLEASYPASGTGVIRVIDPDMNWNPESVNNFEIDVVSDTDGSGISLTVTETNEATGIFEGTVFFTISDSSSGHRLRVSEGDTITAEYDDHTLPDTASGTDDLTITATALIGTIVPPLERVPVSNLKVVDSFGSTLDTVSVDQQVQVSADLTNGQDRDQQFAYLVQIQDEENVTVHLAWITGSVSTGQSFSPAVSWTPAEAGTYKATTFVWESVSNPTALSPPVEAEIIVS